MAVGGGLGVGREGEEVGGAGGLEGVVVDGRGVRERRCRGRTQVTAVSG